MFGTIRKLSYWITIPLFGLVIFSFVFFMASGPARSGGGGGAGSYDTNTVSGEIYGEKVTPERYTAMEHDVDLYFLFNYGEWPDRDPNMTKEAMMREIYIRMMLTQKAKDIGIHVSEKAMEQAATKYLSSPELLRLVNSQEPSVSLSAFVGVLSRVGLTEADFENFVHDDLAMQQLQLMYGLPGTLITPQEASDEYQRQYKEKSAQIVFFSASNYLKEVVVTPDEVGMFYTNFMADYRRPERVSVSYVAFSATNYFAAAEQELEKSNLDGQVTFFFNKYGMQIAPDAKSPEQAKAEIRKELIRQQSLSYAVKDADGFAQAVYNVSSTNNQQASAADLTTVARQEGLPVRITAPFSADYGPQEFTAPPAFTQKAFQLTPQNPISEPVGGPNGVYVMALNAHYDPEIPSLNEIRAQVAGDLQYREAVFAAQRAGTNFARALTMQMAAGKGFASASLSEGLEPVALPPFSLDTREMPELGNVATINQLKQAAFTTPVGMASGFQPTDNGGFVLYLESESPVDPANMTSELPQFTAQFRQQREQQTFNEWVQREASRELRDTPLFHAAAR
jgi:hypothetical protein